jgi:hypothetical protein
MAPQSASVSWPQPVVTQTAREGTAPWSVTSLQRALRKQGMPQISTYTIWHVLTEAGLRWQRTRTWCATGAVWRKRKGKMVLVHDPDTEAKKN